jgi:molybdopterin-binding protein
MTPERINLLVNLYSKNQLSAQDCEDLYEYLNTVAGKDDLRCSGEDDLSETLPDSLKFEKILTNIQKDRRYKQAARLQRVELWPRRNWKWLSVAASLIIVAGLYFFQAKDKPGKMMAKGKVEDILPGTVKAIVNLSDEKSGQYTTIVTPKAAEYHITLPDGSRVWLNSQSSIKYKNDFNDEIREVQMTGEAYFEVAKNKHKPFYVRVNGMSVKVLGTKFNVNAYNANEVKTSLLEGAVSVQSANKPVIQLIPGQEIIVKSKESIVKDTDTDISVAWKDGYFSFQGEDIRSIMQKVAQWYDIEVEFDEGLTNEKFEGTFSKRKNLSELLQSFETVSSLHFKTEGRRITVMK